jgi:hypothetical protein
MVENDRKWVLKKGASSGIGNATAERLAPLFDASLRAMFQRSLAHFTQLSAPAFAPNLAPHLEKLDARKG